MSESTEVIVARASLVRAFIAIAPLIARERETNQSAVRVDVADDAITLYASRSFEGCTAWTRIAVTSTYQSGPSLTSLVLDREHLALVIGALRHDATRDLWLHAAPTRLSVRGITHPDQPAASFLEVPLAPASDALHDVAGMIGALVRTEPVSAETTVFALAGLVPVLAAAKRIALQVRIVPLRGLPGRDRAILIAADSLTSILEVGRDNPADVLASIALITPPGPRWGDIVQDVARDESTSRNAAGRHQPKLLNM
ncbi:hypothetical protein JT358_11660 [Micrococcales bacterium 31B]|nr:hypothetical protein [Micrococcales bacterium 31B]